MIIAGKRRNQHDQGAFRQMEVGNQRIDALELVTGIDEDICPAFCLADFTEEGRDTFQRPAAGSADCDDTAAVFLGFIDTGGGFQPTGSSVPSASCGRGRFPL